MIGTSFSGSILLLSLIIVQVLPSHSMTFYFTNQSLIDKYQNNEAITVIEAGDDPQALDCNSCDGRIYWANRNSIRRSFPNGSNTIENVISVGLSNVKGIAVDWRSNLVYYTDQRDDGDRLEVATCDGSSRRVIFRSDSKNFDIGAVAVDSIHGYIYYANRYCCIYRAHGNGDNRTKIIDIDNNGDEISALAVDQEQNKLYWIEGTRIGMADLDGQNKMFLSNDILGSTTPAGISISNGILYWTREKNSNHPGAIFSYDLNHDSASSTVLEKSSLDPRDISTLVSEELRQNATGGCSNNKGGCSDFCFTMPDPNNSLAISNEFVCGCPTGYPFVADSNTMCVGIPKKFLLIAQGHNVNLLSLDIPSEEIPLPLPFTATGIIEHVSFHASDLYVYWSQRSPPAIMRCKLDGTGMTVIVETSLAKPEGLVMDSSGRTLYWADAALDLIEVLDVDSGHRRVLVDTGLDHPRSLAINEELGYLYWTDTGLNPKLERSFLNGSNRTVLVKEKIFKPGFIAIRPQTNDVYWTEGRPDDYSINKVDRDSPIHNLDSAASGLAFFGNFVYWTLRDGSMIKKIDVTASLADTVEIEVAAHLEGVRSLLSVDTTASTITNECHLNYGDCSDICVNGDTASTCLCEDHTVLMDGSDTDCISTVRGEFLISNGSHVLAVEDERFTNEDSLVHGDVSFYMPVSAARFDVDVRDQMIYWIDKDDGNIYRGPIEDTSNYTREPVLTCCHDNIVDIAVDWWGRNLYWVDGRSGTIGVAKLDGQNNQLLIEGLNNPDHLEIDPYSSQLFFVNGYTTIASVSLTGGVAITEVWSGMTGGSIKDIIIDVTERFLFWTYDNCIYEYRIDTSLPPHSIYCPDGQLSLISYFDERLYVFYFDRGEVYILDEHNSHELLHFIVEFIDPSLTALTTRDFRHFHYTIQPDTHWCTRSNAECTGADSLCLVKDPFNFECRCPATTYLKSGFDNDLEVCDFNCITPETFLLLSTNTKIGYLPLVDNIDTDSCEDPPITVKDLIWNQRQVEAIAYDPLDRRVYWIDQLEGTISSDVLSGTDRKVLKTDPYIRPNSLVYDYQGGNLIWTDAVLSRIEHLNYNGSGMGVLHEVPWYYNIGYRPTPFSAVFDPVKRILYWSNTINRTLNTISLNAGSNLKSSVKDLTDDHNRKFLIQDMALEPKSRLLFFLDIVERCIRMYNLAENELQSQNVSIANVSHVSALTATVYNGVTPMLYWFNISDHSLYSYNATCTSDCTYVKYHQLEEGTVVTSMVAHNNDEETFSHTDCTIDAPCSHLCLSSKGQSTCGCPVHRELINDTTCGAVACDSILHECADQSNCIYFGAFCDGVEHCLDGSDERDCTCTDPMNDFYCNESGINQCIPKEKVCNGDPDCLLGEDERPMYCISCNRSCTLRGLNYMSCIPESFFCDGQKDCMEGEDEDQCTTSTPVVTTSPTFTPTTNTVSAVTPGVIVAIVSCVCVLLLFCVLMCLGASVHYYYNRTKVVNLSPDVGNGAPNGTYALKPTVSPQPVCSQSITASNFSINTMETGSTRVDKISDSRLIKQRLSTISTDPSNPPNSPITERSIAFHDSESIITTPNNDNDMISVATRPVPRVPNPSVDYEADAISENISSVSQRRFPGAIHTNMLPPLYQDNMYDPSHDHTHHPHHPAHLQYMMDEVYEDYPSYPPVFPGDNISESTVSMATYEGGYTTSSYMTNSHIMYQGERERRDLYRDNKTMEEERMGGYYDCPPPPSPVTEYSIHGD